MQSLQNKQLVQASKASGRSEANEVFKSHDDFRNLNGPR